MHNHEYVVCFSKSGVKAVTLCGQAHQPLHSPHCVSALSGCAMRDADHTALQRLEVFLSSLIQIAFHTQKIHFFFFGLCWATVAILG